MFNNDSWPIGNDWVPEKYPPSELSTTISKSVAQQNIGKLVKSHLPNQGRRKLPKIGKVVMCGAQICPSG